MQDKDPIEMTADEILSEIRSSVSKGDQAEAARMLMLSIGLQPGSVPEFFTELTTRS